MIDLPKDSSTKIVQQALSFERPDRLPVYDGFWGDFIENWRQRYHPPADACIEDFYWVDLAVPVATEQLFPTRIRQVRCNGDDLYHDDGWGRIVRTKTGAYFKEPVERIFNAPADLDKIKFDPPDLDMRYDTFLDQVKLHRDKGRAVFVKIGGPFIRSSFFRGETEFLMDLASDERFACAQVEKIGEHLLQIGLESLKRANAYDFGLWIFDDMCNINGPMFSPATFEKVFLPVYKHMVSTLKAAGAKWVMLHCDGNLLPLLDLLIDAGIDGINPVEYSAGLNVATLMQKYHKKLSFIGGVCNTHILPNGDPAHIRAHVQEIAQAGRDGGLVIGTHSVGPDISLDSYELYRTIAAGR